MTAPTFRVRLATPADIDRMHHIRLAVKENRLSDPTRIGPHSYPPFIEARGIWVAERGGTILGFAILDADKRSVWALFVDPDCEGQGVGRALHDHMLDGARQVGLKRLSLTTAPGSRASHFYRALGWVERGPAPGGDVRFERNL